LHGHGWIEGGLCASYEKVILDAEMSQMMEAFLMPSKVNKDTLGVDAIEEVGPAGHFFAAHQTLERYETEHYNPLLSDWRNFESWRDAGSITATQRANTIWKQLLDDYKEPKLAPEVEEELKEFVEKRVSEGGAPPL
jgi:trimethylamine--corrinoid protein Co-methyltransferase